MIIIGDLLQDTGAHRRAHLRKSQQRRVQSWPVVVAPISSRAKSDKKKDLGKCWQTVKDEIM